jgi:hypothetical protein
VETFSIEVFSAAVRFRRGDANDDGTLNISDGIFVLGFLFGGTTAPGCMESANSNDDLNVDLTDGIYVFNHLFLGGPALPPPGPPGEPCGVDPLDSVSRLGCDDYSSCGG